MARRVAFGTYGTQFVARISRPGFDAATETFAENLALDLNWLDLTQIVASGYAIPSGAWFDHDIGRVKLLASFPDMGFVPHVIVWIHSLNAVPPAILSTNTAVYIGYNTAAVTTQGDSYFNSLYNVPINYFVTKLPIDA